MSERESPFDHVRSQQEGERSALIADAPDRIVRRGGDGPEQPEWDEIATYSVEWYRRFRDWHRVEFPDSDQGTRDNQDMLVRMAERG